LDGNGYRVTGWLTLTGWHRSLKLESVTGSRRRARNVVLDRSTCHFPLFSQQFSPYQTAQNESSYATTDKPATRNASNDHALEIIIVRFLAVVRFKDVAVGVGKACLIGLLKNRKKALDIVVAGQGREVLDAQFVSVAGLFQDFDLDDLAFGTECQNNLRAMEMRFSHMFLLSPADSSQVGAGFLVGGR
jgi:hypothetical protein